MARADHDAAPAEPTPCANCGRPLPSFARSSTCSSYCAHEERALRRLRAMRASERADA